MGEWCPVCNGDGALLGALGRLVWFRCVDCGLEWNVDQSNLSEEAREALERG